MSLNIEILSEVSELHAEKRAIKARESQINARLAKINDQAVNTMIDSEIKNLNVKGRIIFVNKDIYAKVPDTSSKEQVCNLLRDFGYGDLIKNTYNANSLSALLREIIKENGELPKEFDGILGTSERLTIRSRVGDNFDDETIEIRNKNKEESEII